jgi:hypothetical protein
MTGLLSLGSTGRQTVHPLSGDGVFGDPPPFGQGYKDFSEIVFYGYPLVNSFVNKYANSPPSLSLTCSFSSDKIPNNLIEPSGRK